MPRITGQADLTAMLRSLPAVIDQGLGRGAIKAAADVIATEARATCRSPDVADSIVVTTKAEPGVVSAVIQTKGPGAYLAPWLERGTLPHLIRVTDEDRKGRSFKRLNALDREGSLVIGGNFVGPVVRHPGARAFPFLRPALDSQQGAAIEAAARYIGDHLTKRGLALGGTQGAAGAAE